MTVRELVSISDGSITAKVVSDGEIIAQFDSKYWESISDTVLDMTVYHFEAVAALMSPAGMLLYTDEPVDEETEPGPEEDEPEPDDGDGDEPDTGDEPDDSDQG